jgi:tRNA (guanosine-2'-O-)-methyltransferase
MRNETRVERYVKKMGAAKRLPLSVCAVNFAQDQNIAFLARALACFSGATMHVIGRIPDYSILNSHSGGMAKFLEFKQYRNPVEFLQANKSAYIVSAELTDGAENLHSTAFPKDQEIIVVLGNEMEGIPQEILHKSNKVVYIPMLGWGYCLNTAMSGNIMLYEISKGLV